MACAFGFGGARCSDRVDGFAGKMLKMTVLPACGSGIALCRSRRRIYCVSGVAIGPMPANVGGRGARGLVIGCDGKRLVVYNARGKPTHVAICSAGKYTMAASRIAMRGKGTSLALPLSGGGMCLMGMIARGRDCHRGVDGL